MKLRNLDTLSITFPSSTRQGGRSALRYVISDDLTQPGQNYTQLWEALEAEGAARVPASQWCGRWNDTTAEELRDHFRLFIDNNDRILVTCIDSDDWSAWNLINRISTM